MSASDTGAVPLLLDLSPRSRDQLSELSPHRHLFHSLLVDRGGLGAYILYSIGDLGALEPVDVQGFRGDDVAALVGAIETSTDPMGPEADDGRPLSLGADSGGEAVYLHPIERNGDAVGFVVGRAPAPMNDDVLDLVGHLLITRRELSSLLRSYDFVRSILHDVSAGLIAIDTLGRVIYVNASAEHILGVSAADAIGADAVRVFRTMVDGDNVLLDGLQGNSNVLDIRVRRGDGREIRLDLRLSQIRSRDGSILGATAIFSDVSELHAMRDQIRHRDRLATIGELAAGIAHEIGNPLTGIKGCAQILRDRLAAEDDSQKLVGVIFEEVDRLARLSNQVRHFARPGEPRMQRASVSEVVEKVRRIVAAEAEDAGVSLHGHPGRLPDIYFDPDQIEQVLLNLAKNAIDAMGERGGRLEIETDVVSRTVRPSPRQGRRSRDRGGAPPAPMVRDYVRVAIRDTGPGISVDEQKRVFDPFFTTKSDGLGLGLSISQTIVGEHSGFLSVESEQGKGTTFIVDLPVDRRAPMRPSHEE